MLMQGWVEERVEPIHLGQFALRCFAPLHDECHVAVDDVVLQPGQTLQWQDLILGDFLKIHLGYNGVHATRTFHALYQVLSERK